ncbi:MAG: dockerin type I repeat-containing protein [Oscillospiraceae bacterium]|nr:dockerin type I repeat-containing protein [Oscillospiraceae bacterium]
MKKTINKIMSAAMAVALMGAVSGGLNQKVSASVHNYSGYSVMQRGNSQAIYSTKNLNLAILVCKDQGLGYSVIQTYSGSSAEIVKFKVGDVTMDGYTSVADLARYQQYMMKDIDYNAEEESRGDVNNDGSADLIDYMYLRSYIAEEGGY